MNSIQYDPSKDIQPVDKFAPCGDGTSLHLPADVTVKFIGTEADCVHLRTLIGKPFVGMDSEWRPTMTKFDLMRPALLQLSDETTAFLIDLVALANN